MRILIFFLLLLFQLGIAVPASSQIPEVLTVANSNAWPPYSFVGENGEPRGILIDLWREFGRRNDKQIKFVLTDWNKSLELVKDGKAMIHGGLYESDERSEYMDFTGPLNLPLNTRLFISIKLNIKKLSELGNIPVDVTRGGFAESYLLKKYPELNLVTSLNDVVVNDLPLAFVTDYPAAMYHLHRLGFHDKYYVAETLYTKRLHLAVCKGDKELLDFIENGMKKIPPEEFDRITQRWIQAVSVTPDWLLPAAITCFGGMAGGFVFLYIFALRRQVASRTRELVKMSRTDMLTGLYNRRKIDEILQREYSVFRRHNRPLTLILLDIDNFKSINDTYGHTVGDEVLVSFAELILSNIRSEDYVGRWGGEEFVLICPETSAREGGIVAEKLRRLIETSQFSTISGCTASFGVAEFSVDDDFIRIFARCDAALYKSKKEGRNRVSIG